MNWRNRLALLFGAASPFAFGSDAHALALPTGQSLRSDTPTIDRDAWTYTDPGQQRRLLLLAGHRSHSSHASHASHYSGGGGHASHSSHSSHYSGSGGYTAPAPSYSPPAPVRSAPAPTSDDPARFSQDQTKEFVRKTQLALIMNGYDPGPADGKLGAKTKDALKKYQEANGLPATGFMDVATLRKLGVIN